VFEEVGVWLHKLLTNVCQSFGCLLTSDKTLYIFLPYL
jgi:hypothetical protein